MQFSSRNYPVLDWIKKRFINDTMSINQDDSFSDKFANFFRDLFQNKSELFSKRIYHITPAVFESVRQSSSKLISKEILSQLPESSGTICNDGFSFCYHIQPTEKIISVDFVIFERDFLLGFFFQHNIGFEQKPAMWFTDADFGWGGKTTPLDEKVHRGMGTILSIVAFLQFAKIETKELLAHKRIVLADAKYINNTESDVILVDSLWYTTLLRSGAFNVRGHFRLQPYKESLKLIWIEEFEKKGYTRKAKKLSFYPDGSPELT